MTYKVELTKPALKDLRSLKAASLGSKARDIRDILRTNPYPSISKQLSGNLVGKRSIRINLQHRLVYEVLEKEKIVKVLSIWGHS